MPEKTFTIKAEVDGYSVRERQLEGALFDVEIEFAGWFTGKVLSVQIQPQHADFFSDFNAEKIYKEITQMVEDDPYQYGWEEADEAVYEEAIVAWGAPDFGPSQVQGG